MNNTAALPAQRRAYTFRDAESVLGISRSSFYRLEGAGKIRLVRIGRRTLIPADEIERLVKEGAR